jgi:hypothetical protein
MMGGTRDDHIQSKKLLLPSQTLRQKRRHTKSRNGCVTCKLRRVKVGTYLQHLEVLRMVLCDADCSSLSFAVR